MGHRQGGPNRERPGSAEVRLWDISSHLRDLRKATAAKGPSRYAYETQARTSSYPVTFVRNADVSQAGMV
jgi:hypothetical protein